MMEKNTLFCCRCELILYYGFGLDLTNFELGIYNLTSDAFFISRAVNQISVSGVDALRAAIALYAPGDTFVSLFENLLWCVYRHTIKIVFFNFF